MSLDTASGELITDFLPGRDLACRDLLEPEDGLESSRWPCFGLDNTSSQTSLDSALSVSVFLLCFRPRLKGEIALLRVSASEESSLVGLGGEKGSKASVDVVLLGAGNSQDCHNGSSSRGGKSSRRASARLL